MKMITVFEDISITAEERENSAQLVEVLGFNSMARSLRNGSNGVAESLYFIAAGIKNPKELDLIYKAIGALSGKFKISRTLKA